jgi:HEAT repeat protein
MSRAPAHTAIFTTNSDLVIETWDSWLESVSGVRAQDAIGRPVNKIIPNLEGRGLLKRFERVAQEGIIEVLAPAFHHYLIPCCPAKASRKFEYMQQRVTISPLKRGPRIVGVLVTIEDVTEQLESESEIARASQGLADSDWQIRRNAVRSLAVAPPAEALPAMLRAIRNRHADPNVLNSALEVLTMSGWDAVPALIEFLRDDDADLRIYAAMTLGQYNDVQAVPALMTALDDPNVNVRHNVIESLGKLRAEEPIDRLVAIAQAGDPFLAFAAIDALRSIGASRVAAALIPLLDDALLSVPVSEALGALGEASAVAPMVRRLTEPHAPVAAIARGIATLYDLYENQYGEGNHIRDLARSAMAPAACRRIVDSLERASSDEIRPLALLLSWTDGDDAKRILTRLLARPDVRKEIVESIQRYGVDVIDGLIAQLDAEDAETVECAIEALGRMGNSRAVEPLVRVMREGNAVTAAAASALAKIGDRRAFDELITLLGHESPAIRQAAAGAINSLGHPDTARRMAVLLQDENPAVRESAIRIAGYFGYPECADQMIRCSADPDDNVRRTALDHLPFLEDERVVPTLVHAAKTGASRVRASAVRALGETVEAMSASVEETLLAAAADEDAWVRFEAARSLGRRRVDTAVTTLIGIALSDPAAQARIAASEALGAIGNAAALETLAPLTRSDDRDLARAALMSLAAMASDAAVPPILVAMSSPEPARRLDAILALAARGDEFVPRIEWAAATAGDEIVWKGAVEELGRRATAKSVAAVIRLTADPAMRAYCIETLARLGAAQGNLLARGLTHPQSSVRRAVVEALARLKSPAASELIGTALDDGDPSVRLASVQAISKLGSRSFDRKLTTIARSDPDEHVRSMAQRAIDVA